MMGSRYYQAKARIGYTGSSAPLGSGDAASLSKFSTQNEECLLEDNVVIQNRPERCNNNVPHEDGEPLKASRYDRLLGIEPGDENSISPLETSGEYQMEHSEGISAISFRYGSSPAFHDSQYNQMESPARNSGRVLLPHEAISLNKQHTSIFREDNPKLEQHQGASQDSAVDDAELTDGLSFITEIAPSCQDLEKFQYRVKRRLIDSEFVEFSLDHDQSRADALCKSSTPRFKRSSIVDEPLDCRQISREAENEMETSLEAPMSSSIAGKLSISTERSISPLHLISLTSRPPDRTTRPLVDLALLHEDDNADNDSHRIDDIAAHPSIVDRVDSQPSSPEINLLPSPMENIRASTPSSGPPESKRPIDLMSVGIASRETTPHYYRSPSVSICHSSLNTPRNQDLMQSRSDTGTLITEHIVVDQDDVSTQSATTIPSSSMSRPQQATSGCNIQQENIATTHAKVGTCDDGLLSEIDQDTEKSETDDEMDAIQTVLSQTYSGLDFMEKSKAGVYDRGSGQTHFEDTPTEDANNNNHHGQHATKGPVMHLQPGQRVPHDRLGQDLGRYRAGGIFATAQEGQTPVQSLGTLASNYRHGNSRSAVGREVDDPRAPDPSVESWEGCGTQSPWTAEPTEAAAKANSKFSVIAQQVAFESSSELPTTGANQDAVLQSPRAPNTPNNLLPGAPNQEENSIPSTQMLVEAAMKNPWNNSSKNFNLSKSKKRVSFGGLLSDEKENMEIHVAKQSPSYQHIRGASSPSTSFDQHQPIVQHDEQVAMNEEPEKRPALYRRALKRILPDQSASQLHSSPAGIDAMAEAFISADRDMASLSGNEQRRIKSKSPVRRHKALLSVQDDVWKVKRPSIDWSPNPFNAQEDGFTTTDFDMQAALGEMGDFLEDWSVEAELKKARVAGSQHGVSSDPEKRSVFGMM